MDTKLAVPFPEVACPTCGAKEGVSCAMWEGEPKTRTCHLRRWRRAIVERMSASVTASILERVCPTCGAKTGELCTPTDATSRKAIKEESGWFHAARARLVVQTHDKAEITLNEMRLQFECPVCGAQPGFPCMTKERRSTRHGKKTRRGPEEMHGMHTARGAELRSTGEAKAARVLVTPCPVCKAEAGVMCFKRTTTDAAGAVVHLPHEEWTTAKIFHKARYSVSNKQYIRDQLLALQEKRAKQAEEQARRRAVLDWPPTPQSRGAPAPIRAPACTPTRAHTQIVDISLDVPADHQAEWRH